MAELNKIVEKEGEDEEKLKEELSACQHILLDTEMKNGRHKVFNLQISKLDTEVINEKLEEVFYLQNLFLSLSQKTFIKKSLSPKTTVYLTIHHSDQ